MGIDDSVVAPWLPITVVMICFVVCVGHEEPLFVNTEVSTDSVNSVGDPEISVGETVGTITIVVSEDAEVDCLTAAALVFACSVSGGGLTEDLDTIVDTALISNGADVLSEAVP